MIRIAFAFVLLPVVLFAVAASAVTPADLIVSAIDTRMVGAIAFFMREMYGFLFVVALPVLLFCLWRRWLRPLHMVVIGVITGLAVVASTAVGQLLDSKLHLHYRLEHFFYYVLGLYPVLLFAGLGGALFWFAALWRNPYVVRLAASGASALRRDSSAA